MAISRVRPLCLVALLGLVVFATSCIYTQSSKIRYSGQTIKDGTLNRIVPGETTKADLIAAIGEPTTSDVRPDGTEVLRYTSERVVERKSGFIFLFHSETTTEEVKTVVFELRDDVLQSYRYE